MEAFRGRPEGHSYFGSRCNLAILGLSLLTSRESDSGVHAWIGFLSSPQEGAASAKGRIEWGAQLRQDTLSAILKKVSRLIPMTVIRKEATCCLVHLGLPRGRDSREFEQKLVSPSVPPFAQDAPGFLGGRGHCRGAALLRITSLEGRPHQGGPAIMWRRPGPAPSRPKLPWRREGRSPRVHLFRFMHNSVIFNENLEVFAPARGLRAGEPADAEMVGV